jgi:type VI secretion system protein ImpC
MRDPSYRISDPRPQRVHLTYDDEASGVIQKRTIPFVVGVLADLTGPAGRERPDREFVEIDIDNFDSILAQFAPELRIEVRNDLMPDSTLRLRFTAMADFGPVEIIRQIEPLQQLLQVRQDLAALLPDADTEPDLDARIEFAMRGAPAEVLRLAMMPAQPTGRDPVQALEKVIETIDDRLSRQLSAIMHHPAFQRLEAAWRGLHYLVSESETSSLLKIKVLPVTRRELSKDILRTASEQVSAEPFGLFVADYEFGPEPEEIELLKSLAEVAADAHAPLIGGASPAFFGVKSFSQLTGPNVRRGLLLSAEHAEWSAFRKTENARYVGLCLPHFLLRKPYGDEVEVEQFGFREMADGRTEDKHLWGNTAFVLAARFTEAFHRYGWCAAVQGMEGGGRAERLLCTAIHSGDGRIEISSPTDFAVLEPDEGAFALLGFITLLPYRGTDMAVFFTIRSIHDYRASGDANAGLAAQLRYVMAASRFAHFLKVIMQGQAALKDDCEILLNHWIARYILPPGDEAGSWAKAQWPLRDARIEVNAIPGEPGAYWATMYLRPRFQLDELTTPLQVRVHLKQNLSGKPSYS